MSDPKIIYPFKDMFTTVGDDLVSESLRERVSQANQRPIPPSIGQHGGTIEIGKRTIALSNELQDSSLSTTWTELLLDGSITVEPLQKNDVILLTGIVSYIVEDYEGVGFDFTYSVDGVRLDSDWVSHREHGYDGSGSQVIETTCSLIGHYTVSSQGFKVINVQHRLEGSVSSQSVAINEVSFYYQVYRPR